MCGSPASCAALLLLSGGGDSRYIAASFIELNVRPRKLHLRVVGSTYGILSDFPISFAHLPESRFGVFDKNDNSKERQIEAAGRRGALDVGFFFSRGPGNVFPRRGASRVVVPY